MTRLIFAAAALAVISATALQAGCPVHGSRRGPHFFSARQYRARVHGRLQDRMYRMGLTRTPPSGDMQAHTPYETWENYYYDRPYQARQSGRKILISNGTIQSALAQFYEQRAREWKATAGQEGLLEYAQ